MRELKAELAMRDALAGRGRVGYEDLGDAELRELHALARRFLQVGGCVCLRCVVLCGVVCCVLLFYVVLRHAVLCCVDAGGCSWLCVRCSCTWRVLGSLWVVVGVGMVVWEWGQDARSCPSLYGTQQCNTVHAVAGLRCVTRLSSMCEGLYLDRLLVDLFFV